MQQKGFTLIELMVSVALFAVVMTVSAGALLALVDATQKAQALQSVISNLNTALDGMVRSMRMGHEYYCGSAALGVQDCANGDDTLSFTPYGADPDALNQRWVYTYDAASKRLFKSEDGGLNYFALTAPEVQIDEFAFYVVGTTPGDTTQPKVVMVIKGTAGATKIKTRTTFTIQATATQRVLDI